MFGGGGIAFCCHEMAFNSHGSGVFGKAVSYHFKQRAKKSTSQTL